MNWDAFGKWFIGLLDLNFVSICFILFVVAWFLWCQDREERTKFKIVNFFMTNGHEDMAKLVLLLMTVVIMWGFIQQVKNDELTLYELLAYMAFGLGAPMFYSLLKVVTAVFGKPEIVNRASTNAGTDAPQPNSAQAPTMTPTDKG